jgi:DNA-binding PadR family transcriptional regulator
MADENTSETGKISKTELILSLIAEQGPKTEYDIYKQFPELSHGTIHFCLNKLTQYGSITYTKNNHRKKQTKKLYHLTFIGAVTHIASFLYWKDMQLTDSQIEEHWKRFEEENQDEILEFLFRQGKLLKYPLFEESKWLAEHYPGIAFIFASIAYMICTDPPKPFRNLLVVAASGAFRKNHPQLKGESTSEDEEPSKEELNELMQNAFRREFTRLFLEFIVVWRHKSKSIFNPRLRRLAEEALEEKKHETVRLELAVQRFGRPANKNDSCKKPAS